MKYLDLAIKITIMLGIYILIYSLLSVLVQNKRVEELELRVIVCENKIQQKVRDINTLAMKAQNDSRQIHEALTTLKRRNDGK